MAERQTGKISAGYLQDPIAMEVFSNRLLSVTEEMGHTLVRASFSTNIKERKDCSVGLFDARGRLIAQASHVPLHLGSLMGGVEAVLAHYDLSAMTEGDAFVCNDPYVAGGTHMPDISVITPVVHEGAVRFFAANIAHHSDVGGSVPGSIAGTARSVFEEGLRIPAVRIAAGGHIDDGLLRMIALNSRDPKERELDLKVQVAANARGGALMQALLRRMGHDVVERSVADLLAYTGERLRRALAALGDGESRFTSWLDDDGQPGDPVPIVATVKVRNGRLSVDFTGTGPEARGAMNVPESALRASVYFSVKALVDPALLPNSGFFDAIQIRTPAGSIVSPRHPAAVGARSITCNKIVRAVFGAFAPLLPPERAMAAGHDAIPAIVFSGSHSDRAGDYVYLETMGGGAGASAVHDGMDAVHVHMTNTSNLPIEALEHEYTLRVDEYALVEDSAGAGEFRGGLGMARQIQARRDGVIFSVRSDGHLLPAPGQNGGSDGRPARLVRNFGQGDEEELPSKVSRVVMKAGDSMRLETAGGGGFGEPEMRAIAALAWDLTEGKISPQAAERDYGSELFETAQRQAAVIIGERAG